MAGSDEILIGGFRLLAKLKADAGMQGTVYRAVCETDDFPQCPRGTVVALKTMGACGEDSDRAYERLRERTEILKGIDHPNLVKYYGCFTEQQDFSEIHVVVEELLEGETLKDRLAGFPNGLDADEAVRIVTAMVAGLGAAAAAGVAHRDVKPANVFLCKDGAVKIIDFEVGDSSSGSTVSAVSGNMVGSFDYMAPDFTDPHFIGDELSDVFSAGVVMHEVFSGRLPYPRFPGDSRQANFAFLERWPRDANGDFPRGALTVSSRVERFVAHAKQALQQALEPRRERRFQSFAAFSAALAAIRFRDLRNGDVSYRMLQLIGKGGFGEVFKARSCGRTVAVKHLLKPEYASRFYREAKIMSELNDPCFVRFFDFFVLEHAGRKEAFLVMDYLPGMPGSSLRDAIRKSAGCGLDYDSVLRAFIRYAHGLKVIHEKGVFHRDIKPSNLYYPEDRPGDAAIMDLGIARETDGTETTGQVPGTLDYMPPETAMTGMRGDAGMDIYALGLCLYEALTGKKGFPRLPTGSAAYAQFFKRAREKVRPTLDDERVLGIPGLHKLITWMTEPESKDRLSDAGRLEEELVNLRDRKAVSSDVPQGGAVSPEPVPAVQPAADEPAAPGSAEEDDSETCETAFVAPSEIAKAAQEAIHSHIKQSARSEKPVVVARYGKRAFAWAAAAALCGVAFLFRGTVIGWFDDVAGLCHAFEPGVSSKAPVVVSGGEDLGVPDLYGDSGITLAEADALRDRWLDERKPPVHSKSEYERLAGILAAFREQRIIRDRLLAERSRMDDEFRKVAETYRKEGIAAGDASRETWFKTWKSASKEKTAEAVQEFANARSERIQYEKAQALVREAESAAAKVAHSYSASGTEIADRECGVWKNDWKDRLQRDDFVRICKTMSESRDRQLRKQAWEKRKNEAKALHDECMALIDMIEPVASRASRLDEAEMRLKQGRTNDLVDERAYGEIAAEIERRRAWVVFGVVNNTDHELEIDGIRLQNGESHLFAYTNAPLPKQLAATCFGFEPMPLGGVQSDGKVLRLLPEHFTIRKVEVKAGELPPDVVCHVDGRPVKAGAIRLTPGSHECVYSRKDYRSQSIPFRLELGVASVLPPPGEWARTEEWQQRERDRVRTSQVAAFESAFRAKLADDPLGTRQARLEECRKAIEDGKAAELLGNERLTALRNEWKRANARGIGIVDNRANLDFVVRVDGREIPAKSGMCTRIEFDASGAGELALQKDGYAPIRIPGNFNGSKMVVMPSHLNPLPVRVSLPKLADGMSCAIDGAAMASHVDLAPGPHVCVFSRPDYQDVQHAFEVAVGTPMTLPLPADWKAGEAIGHLVAAETAADAGDWNGVRAQMDLAAVTGDSALKRKLALAVRLRRHEQFAIRRDRAAEAIREARWSDAVNAYAMLWLDGCELTDREFSLARDASDKALETARFQLKLARRSQDKKRIEKAERELQTVRTQVSVLRVGNAPPQARADNNRNLNIQ